LYIVQGEWIVKRRICAATLNNRGSIDNQRVTEMWLFFYFPLRHMYQIRNGQDTLK